ncbi:MAG TPA: extracellular solute-binding protein [Thermomicrobiales bacterium]|nr:extracellular solute-binding protein [Thermomicrobiales bacterium]
MAAGAGLALGGCSPLDGEEDVAEEVVTAPAELVDDVALATQAPPTPTQAPVASAVPGYLDPERWYARSLVVATAGVGDYLEALTAAFFEPFSEATGVTVQHQAFGRDGIANLVDQVENGEVVWDVVLIPTGDVLPLAQHGYLEPIDYAIVDSTSLYEPALMQHGVGAMYYSTVMTSSAALEDEPDSWDDFWDLMTFDGTRALRRYPVGTLEFALLAAGVPQDELYPLDVPLAFEMLDLIREATIFYEDNKQPVELVRTGQVGLASAWNIRAVLPDVTSLVNLHWQGGMISADSWAVPRGTENLDVAMGFIDFATRAVPSANFSLYLPFGPANRDALELIRPDVVEVLPTGPAHLEVQFFENWAYWADNRDELVAQFEDWLLNPTASPTEG